MGSEFITYDYEPKAVWQAIERERERLGFRKTEVSKRFHAPDSYYANCLASYPDMRLSVAVKMTAVVGLTLDEALRGADVSRYQHFLDSNSIKYERLPKDCLLRRYNLKSVIPTFYSAIELCKDPRLVSMVQSTLIMEERCLSQFFFTMVPTGSIAYTTEWMRDCPMDYTLLDRDAPPGYDFVDVQKQFWRGGVYHQIGTQVGFENFEKFDSVYTPRFAERLGISVGQLYKYVRDEDEASGENRKKAPEPRLGRSVAICNAINTDIDYMLEPVYSIRNWSNVDLDTETAFSTPFSRWYDRFYKQFRSTFRAFPLLQFLVERYRTLNENERNDMESFAASLSCIK